MNRADITAIIVWAFLVIATLITGLMPDHLGLDGRWAVASLMVLAAIKARMIVLHYMELKHAPMAWRLFFEAWVIIVAAILIFLW